MSITKPFTFVAGTKARANEVNQNFDVLYSQVNSNISAINTNANDIDTLDSNKANVNGSSSQRFACADPTSPSDAVNKQSLTKAIGNSINYIDGYVISKDSGSPNNAILVTAGSCYDYTKSVVLAKDTSTTKQNTSQGASTTYYVYVIGSDSGISVDILISSSAVTPALPEGYAKFRQIGKYTTDSSSNINKIIYYGYDQSNPVQDYQVNYKMMPDYTAGTSVGTGDYTPVRNGFLIGNATDRSDTSISVRLGSVVIIDSFSTSFEGSNSWCVPLAKGKTYTIGGGNWVRNNFYPCIGEV
jgi:hypothetical protein